MNSNSLEKKYTSISLKFVLKAYFVEKTLYVLYKLIKS